MKKVPESSPNYQTAQTKVLEYQNYLDIAKQRVNKAPDTELSDPWYFAVRSAQSAAKKAQTAQTKSEWNAVANDWQKAVDLMKQVPESNPNYQTAQTKVVEFQNYLDIAKQRTDRATN